LGLKQRETTTEREKRAQSKGELPDPCIGLNDVTLKRPKGAGLRKGDGNQPPGRTSLLWGPKKKDLTLRGSFAK